MLTEMMLTDYMYQEKGEEEDLPAFKTALTYRYNDSRKTRKTRYWQHDDE